MNSRLMHYYLQANPPDRLKLPQGIGEREHLRRAAFAGRNRSFDRSFCDKTHGSLLGRRHPPIVVGIALELALDTANEDVAFTGTALARRKAVVVTQRDAATWLGDAVQACAQAGWLLACADRFAASLLRDRRSSNSSGAGACGSCRRKQIRLLADTRSAEANNTREAAAS